MLVKPGDAVAKEQSLITLESDKATMEIPSPSAGVVKELKIKVGDKVSKGAPILVLAASRQRPPRRRREAPLQRAAPAPLRPPAPAPAPRRAGAAPRPVPREPQDETARQAARQPSVRKFARELGVDLAPGAGQRAEGPHPARGRAGVREGRAVARRPRPPPPKAAAARCRSTCRPGRRSTSPSSARSSPSRCRASRSSPAPTCTATGSRSRTSRSSTRPTSPTSRPSARRRPPRPRRRASS